MMKPGTALLGVLLLVAVLPACGSGAGPADEVRRQLLRHQQVKRHNRLFYVGIADADSFEEARATAFAEISRQLTWLPEKRRGVLEGQYRVDRVVTDRDGRLHLLAVLERQGAAAHLVRVARERRAELQVVLGDCTRRLEAGQLEQARGCMAPVDGRLKQIRDLLAASRAALGDPPRAEPFAEEQEARELVRRLGDAKIRGKVVLVHVLRVVDGSVTGDLNAEFGRVVSEQGFRRLSGGAVSQRVLEQALAGKTLAITKVGREAGAGYVVAGRVKARFTSEESGQYFAWARGQLHLIETTAGKIVAELSNEQIKGGHLTRQQACDKAIANAVARLKAELGRKLSALN